MDAKKYIQMQEERDQALLSFIKDKEENKQILQNSDEESDGGAGASSSSGEEEDNSCDIEFPRNDAAELLQFLHREINNLGNLEDG